MNIFQGFRKLLFCVIAASTGMVVGYQLSRVLFANVRLCLGIGAVCAVILGILAFRFYRAGLFLVCAVLMFFVIKTLLHREDWWVYPVSSLAALAAGYSVFLLEKPAENISETSDVTEEKGKDKREKKSHGGAYYIGDDTKTCGSDGMIVNAWMNLPMCYTLIFPYLSSWMLLG